MHRLPVCLTRKAGGSRGGEEISLNAGETLAVEGDPGEHFFVILEGEVRITKRYGRQEIALATHTPGNFWGGAAAPGDAVLCRRAGAQGMPSPSVFERCLLGDDGEFRPQWQAKFCARWRRVFGIWKGSLSSARSSSRWARWPRGSLMS